MAEAGLAEEIVRPPRGKRAYDKREGGLLYQKRDYETMLETVYAKGPVVTDRWIMGPPVYNAIAERRPVQIQDLWITFSTSMSIWNMATIEAEVRGGVKITYPRILVITLLPTVEALVQRRYNDVGREYPFPADLEVQGYTTMASEFEKMAHGHKTAAVVEQVVIPFSDHGVDTSARVLEITEDWLDTGKMGRRGMVR